MAGNGPDVVDSKHHHTLPSSVAGNGPNVERGAILVLRSAFLLSKRGGAVTEPKNTTIRLDQRTRYALQALAAAESGGNTSALVRGLIEEEAKRRGVWVDDLRSLSWRGRPAPEVQHAT